MSELLRHFVLPQWGGCARTRARTHAQRIIITYQHSRCRRERGSHNGPQETDKRISERMGGLIGERKSGHFSLAVEFAAGWEDRPLSTSPSVRPTIHPSSICRNGGAENICSYQVITVQAKTAGGAVPTSSSSPQLSPHPTSLGSAAPPGGRCIIPLKRERRVEGNASQGSPFLLI